MGKQLWVLAVGFCLGAGIMFEPALAGSTTGDTGDWGDAPDGVLAYPASGVAGQFPTCSDPLGKYVWHAAVVGVYFGQQVDYESDGNGGICPSFTPHNFDECFRDNDAGLLFPEPFTILGDSIGLCPADTQGQAVQDTCKMAIWGVDIDIDLARSAYGEAYVSVLFDWNQDGVWGDTVHCGTTSVPELVLRNLYVPPSYSGPLSVLGPPNFRVGPKRGYVWARFTVSPSPVLANWDGSGVFESGETEDYLLLIAEPSFLYDYGDAPEGELAYPSLGREGQFPTCMHIGRYGFIQHAVSGVAWFGGGVDGEADGNAGYCQQPVPFPPYDLDECFKDGDAGLIRPAAYTIAGGNVVRCNDNYNRPLGPPCGHVEWGRDIDVYATNNSGPEMYVNLLVDWNRDGVWGGQDSCGAIPVPEHVLVDFLVPPGFNQPLSALNPPSFVIGPDTGYFWTRFTICSTPVGADWNGEGQFEDGETEDYLLWVSESFAGAGRGYEPGQFKLGTSNPNPFTGKTSISFEIPYDQWVRLAVYDALGRQVKLLFDTVKLAGKHEIVWDGTDAWGHQVTPGIYFLRLESAGYTRTQRLVLIR